MDFAAGLFLGAFTAPILLWTALSWWALIIVIGGLLFTEAIFYKDDHVWAFVVLMLVFVFSVFMMTDAEGFWGSSWAVLRGTFWAMLNYVIIGMIVAVPLWLWFVRKFYVKLRTDLAAYVKKMSEYKGGDSIHGEDIPALSDELKQRCKTYKSGDEIPTFLKEQWVAYRTSSLRIGEGHINVANNIDELSSMIFLWPFHIITLIFGDFIAQIPVWFVQYFGKVLDSFARIARVGIPSGIDKD